MLLFSKGLDSLLAGKIIQSQGVEVIPITFITPFFDWKYFYNPQLYYDYCKSHGFAESHLINVTEEYLQILKKPKYGFGCLANPCVACKIFMLSKSKSMMKSLNADFIITGEVIGQRPKSQNRRALEIIKNESNVYDLLVRPLSAKLLPPSLPEKLGWIDRSKLYAIYGRNRKIQFKLASMFGITDFETPAGGCLLTDPQIGRRILQILHENRPLNTITAQLSVIGRHIFDGDTWIVLGRTHNENKKIYNICKGIFPLFTLSEPAPVAAILQGESNHDKIKELLISFSHKSREKVNLNLSVELVEPDEEEFGDKNLIPAHLEKELQ
ncbi:MAG: thiamine biosynthesis protein [Ignavibacteria bacterium]|nr:thiamine biosynthesis protein [Ignavibacteria bacterium]